jgi:hypothetical protein
VTFPDAVADKRPTVTWTIFVAGSGDLVRYRATCPFHRHPRPAIFRSSSRQIVEQAAVAHMMQDHPEWRLVGFQAPQ